METLIKAGAIINIPGENEFNCLHIAAQDGNQINKCSAKKFYIFDLQNN